MGCHTHPSATTFVEKRRKVKLSKARPGLQGFGVVSSRIIKTQNQRAAKNSEKMGSLCQTENGQRVGLLAVLQLPAIVRKGLGERDV